MGISPNIAFAAGTAIIELNRYLTVADYDILIIHEGLAEQDAKLLQSFHNTHLMPYEPTVIDRSKLPANYPYAFIYRFEIFKLLKQYKTVIWLDCDIAIQGDISPLMNYGPFAMAISDDSFLQNGAELNINQRNFTKPIEGYNMDAPLYNSGVLVFKDTLPLPEKLYTWCMKKFIELFPYLYHFDQSIFNLFVQQFPELSTSFSALHFNCYPLSNGSATAPIVHCFGSQKIWNNALLAHSFPEWVRDYQLWRALGGTCYTGPVLNESLLGMSNYKLLTTLLEKFENAEKA